MSGGMLKKSRLWLRLICDVVTVFSLAFAGMIDSLLLTYNCYEYGSVYSVIIRITGSILSIVGAISLNLTRKDIVNRQKYMKDIS